MGVLQQAPRAITEDSEISVNWHELHTFHSKGLKLMIWESRLKLILDFSHQNEHKRFEFSFFLRLSLELIVIVTCTTGTQE